jgi:hypothetical protein
MRGVCLARQTRFPVSVVQFFETHLDLWLLGIRDMDEEIGLWCRYCRSQYWALDWKSGVSPDVLRSNTLYTKKGLPCTAYSQLKAKSTHRS